MMRLRLDVAGKADVLEEAILFVCRLGAVLVIFSSSSSVGVGDETAVEGEEGGLGGGETCAGFCIGRRELLEDRPLSFERRLLPLELIFVSTV